MYKNNMGLKHYFFDRLRWVYYTLFNFRHKFNMARYKKCQSKKSAKQMADELVALKEYWGCVPMQYYTHDFYRSDCNLSLDEMKAYIPGYYFYNLIYPIFDDVKQARGALENKILSYYVFKGMCLPTTEMIAIKKGDQVFDSNGRTLSNESFELILKKITEQKIFIKPVDGKGGVGILVAKKFDTNFMLNEKILALSDLYDLKGDFVIEKQVMQSNYLNNIYSKSVNTLRAVTKRSLNGNVELVAVTLRMGTGGREVDNGSQGGLLIGIDLKTGKPIRDYAGYEYGAEKIFQHPDTGFKFTELLIENWHDVSSQIVNFAEQMLLQNLIGWDIALTDNGPLVIEANTMFGIDHSQSGVGGMIHFFQDDIVAKNN